MLEPGNCVWSDSSERGVDVWNMTPGKPKGHGGAADLELFKESFLVQKSQSEGLRIQRDSLVPTR